MGPTGLITGVAFAMQRHRVLGFDADPNRNQDTARGRPPFYEPGLRQTLRKMLSTKQLVLAPDTNSAVRGSDIVFLFLGTPSRPHGSIDHEAPIAAAHTISERAA